MPLLACVDCGKEHSTEAPQCPNCGRPNVRPEWAVSIDGTVYKTPRIEDLRDWVATRRVQAQHHVLAPGAPAWRPAADVPELKSAFAPFEAQSSRSLRTTVIVLLVIVGGLVLISVLTRPRPRPAPLPSEREAGSPSATSSDALSNPRRAQELVDKIPIFESYRPDGVGTRLQLNASMWNSFSRSQQRQFGDQLASREIVREIGSPIKFYVYETKVGEIRQSIAGDWTFELQD